MTHGPAKFAQFISTIDEVYPEHQAVIFTEDAQDTRQENLILINIKCPRFFHAFLNIIRGVTYHKQSRQIRKNFPFDVIIYNNAINGFWSASFRYRDVITFGLINDSLNLRVGKFSKYQGPIRKWIIRNVFKFFERLAARNMDGVLVNSNFLRNEVIEKYKISPQKVFVLFKGIDLSKFEFCPKEQISLEKAVKVLFVKNNYQVGGLFYLIEALGLLQAIPFELIVVGPAPEKEMIIKEKASGFENISIKFFGPQPQTEVIRQLMNSDLLSIPSVSEGLGVANMEGLAVGIPVVSTRVGGIPEVLGNGAYGWLAEPGNPGSLASCIEICLNSPEERNRKVRAGREFVEKQFSHTVMLDNFLTILEEVKAKA